MPTQYYTAASLDGFIATEDDSLEWLFSLGDVADTGYAEFFAGVGAIAMGATTYEWIVAHGIDPERGTQAPWPYSIPTWVFTHRDLRREDDADVRFVQGDVRTVHEAMRAAAGDRNLWIVGGGELAGRFLDAGLLDELIITIGSVTLGRGKPLLPRMFTSPPLQLTSARAIGPGLAELKYAVPSRSR